jgi:hypothetical protein
MLDPSELGLLAEARSVPCERRKLTHVVVRRLPLRRLLQVGEPPNVLAPTMLEKIDEAAHVVTAEEHDLHDHLVSNRPRSGDGLRQPGQELLPPCSGDAEHATESTAIPLFA